MKSREEIAHALNLMTGAALGEYPSSIAFEGRRRLMLFAMPLAWVMEDANVSFSVNRLLEELKLELGRFGTSDEVLKFPSGTAT